MKSRLIEYIVSTSVFQGLISFLKRIRFRKADVTLYEVITIFLEKLTKDEVIERAESVAFNFTLSIFPATIFLFTLVPFIQDWIPGVDLQPEDIMAFISNYMPKSMFNVIDTTVADIIGKQRGGLLTFGALFSLVLSTSGMLALMKAFNACYKTKEKRGFLRTRLVALGLTFMLALVLILATVTLIVGDVAKEFIETHWQGHELNDYWFVLLPIRFVFIFIVFFMAISFIYYFGPTVHYNWRFWSFGSLLATFASLGVSYLFSFYVSNFGTYNKLYGSIGVLIALMIWQLILSIVLLVGYELNAAIHKAHYGDLEPHEEI